MDFGKSISGLGLSSALIFVGLAPSSAADEATLYMAEAGGLALRDIDPASGFSSVHQDLPRRSMGDLVTDPTDPNTLYATWTARGTEDFTPAWISRLDTQNRDTEDLAVLEPSWFGFSEDYFLGVHGLAISHLDPTTAIISASEVSRDWRIRTEDYALLRFDLETLQPLGPAVAVDHYFNAMTFTPDGRTLLGATGFFDGPVDNTGSDLYEINALTGALSRIGYTGSRDLTGLAFHPHTHALYGIDAYFTDELVTLDPSTGAINHRIGSAAGLIGPDGLAFSPAAVPEPSTFLLLAVSAVGLIKRRGRAVTALAQTR